MRKIESDAWVDRTDDDSDSISDLSTKNHELSVWKIKDDLSDIEDIALALAMTRDNTGGIWVVLLDPEKIERNTGFKVEITDQPGQSAYLGKNAEHKNFMLYTVTDMCHVATYIHSLIDEDQESLIMFFDEALLTGNLNKKFHTGEITRDMVKDKGRWMKKFKEYEKNQKK